MNGVPSAAMPRRVGNNDPVHDLGLDRSADDRRGRIGAHAAGVRPLVAVEQTLVVLRRGEGDGPRPVAQGEERGFLAEEHVLDHHGMAGGAEGAGEHGGERRLGLRQRLGDDDSLPGGEAVRLDDDRRAARAQIGERRFERLEARIVGGRNAETPAKILAEPFGPLELRSRATRAEGRNARGLEIVDEPGDERRLGPDDDEADRHQPAEIDHRAMVGDVDADAIGHGRDAGIAGRRKESPEPGATAQRQGDRMLATAGAEQKNIRRHRRSSNRLGAAFD